ncbi:MAG: ribulose-phosphate 3-epimerase [Eubacteriales bacterium]|nr:ribulose-phosphate 3-epimerase [Eubacteriales bacterium]
MIEIAPSVLAADPLHVHRDVSRLVAAGAQVLHLDIMDGHFVPNLSFGPQMVSALRRDFPEMTLDVHLMLSSPGRFFKDFANAGADEITLHCEADGDIPAMLEAIRRLGKKAGISLKPATKVTEVLPYIEACDLFLIMTVEPGFGGQQLMPGMLDKLGELRRAGFDGTLSVDGGVGRNNCRHVVEKGATRLVMGTAAFHSADPKALFEGCGAR